LQVFEQVVLTAESAKNRWLKAGSLTQFFDFSEPELRVKTDGVMNFLEPPIRVRTGS
jgi:hypothetical protein